MANISSRFSVKSLGIPQLDSPLELKGARYHEEPLRILFDPHTNALPPDLNNVKSLDSFEVAGPGRKIYFFPPKTRAAIVTCGGLCPGLNAVIRALVLQLRHRYEVKQILGIRYGYQGLGPNAADSFVDLTPELVVNIHEQGGTILGSSRGTPPTSTIVDNLVSHGIDILFTIGGDGTMRGAEAIVQEAEKRSLRLSVIGIPKTIDNDIPYVRRSFGFESAVAIACQAVMAAHEEARGAENGVGLVKLMGRHSGYIAANVAVATGHVNFCLVPEIDFKLEGEDGLLRHLERRLDKANHAVIAVAEGAGQHFFSDHQDSYDASGNKKLGDIGAFLKDAINEHFSKKGTPFSLKYIDPSYIIRATPANPADRLFCTRLAQNAVHAAMAGKTGMLVGYWHGRVTHVPFSALKDKRQTIDPSGELWFNVLESTGQPLQMG